MTISRRDFLRASSAASLLVATGHWRRLAWGAPDSNTISPFLQGNFAPVRDEVTFDSLEVIGQLPAELNGMFVRNGPNPQFAPKGNYHWFDGDGMLHGLRIADQRASYRNRYVRTTGWTEEHAAGKSLYSGLADPLDFDQILRGKSPFKNAANTALVWHDGRLLALWEGGEPHEIEVPDLATVGPYTYGGKLQHPFTAHPKVDPQTGEMLFFGYSPLLPQVQYSIVDAQGQMVRTEIVRLRRPVMMHDFAVTARYSIFMDLPVVLAPGVTASAGKPAGGMSMRFDRDAGARFGILPRHGRGEEIRWFSANSCFVFHTLGAYEEGDEIVLIACRMDDYPDIFGIGKPAAKNGDDPATAGPQAKLYRWRFNLKTGAVNEGPLDDVACDFPRFDERRLGRSIRYAYCTPLTMGGLLKYDLVNGTCRRHEFGPGRLGGEAVFIARPGGQAEDDGWLCTFVFDQSNSRSELVLIDARDFTSPPVARIKIPVRIPFGFHGIWLDRLALEQA